MKRDKNIFPGLAALFLAAASWGSGHAFVTSNLGVFSPVAAGIPALGQRGCFWQSSVFQNGRRQPGQTGSMGSSWAVSCTGFTFSLPRACGSPLPPVPPLSWGPTLYLCPLCIF